MAQESNRNIDTNQSVRPIYQNFYIGRCASHLPQNRTYGLPNPILTGLTRYRALRYVARSAGQTNKKPLIHIQRLPEVDEKESSIPSL